MQLGQNTPGRDLKARYLYLGLSMTAGLLVLAINLYRLQIIHGEELLAKSQDNYIKEVRVRADRGMILDRRGEVLVDGRPSFNVYVTPAFCQRCSAEVLPRLSPTLGWDEGQLSRVEQMLKEKHGTQRFQPWAVKVDVTRDELDVLAAHQTELPGVDVVPVQHRNYRAGPVLAHVLGYMNEVTQDEVAKPSAGPKYALGDYIGRRGLERAFEARSCPSGPCGLRGSDGASRQFVNARGEAQRDKDGRTVTEEEVLPAPGNNLILSIDARLQAEAERAFPGTAGAVLAVDVRTGFVLAMLSRPSFDPNVLTGRINASQMAALARDPLQPMVFRAVAQHYSPGSTFKTFSLLAALRSGVFGPSSTAFCPGGYRLGSRVWRCHKDSGHGTVDTRTSLKVSCDTFYYRVADSLGLDPIARLGKDLGLGAPTGIGVVAEVPGIMPDSAYHDRVTPGGYMKGLALNSAIGQGDVNVTPLQLLMAYAAIGNGGTLYQPQLVRRIESPDGRVLEEFQPKILRRLDLSPEHQKLVVDALVAVVNEPGGTGGRARLKEVVVAGKTGTAQVIRLGEKREKKEEMDYFERDHAWFVAFAPAEDPELAVVVLNEHGGHGGSEAAPTAKAVIAKYFELKKTDALAFGGSSFEREKAPPARQSPPPKGPEQRGPALARSPPPDGGSSQESSLVASPGNSPADEGRRAP
ncbi:MAG: penicillin-binding protein 2 [Myxococcales bacterium]|nr:penicillin-binding protein 2 [Myxococcales bacterium]